MRICFTGRPGPTDELMIQQLAEAGFRLEVVAFPAPRDADTPPGVVWRPADLSIPGDWQSALDGSDLVVHRPDPDEPVVDAVDAADAMFQVVWGIEQADHPPALLLVLGGPVTLALRALHPSTPPGPREWIVGLIDSPLARLVYHPLAVFALFVGSYYALYLTGLFEYMSRDHWAHQVMNVHFVFVGMLYYGLVIGVDRTPFQLPHVARLGYLFAAMPFHAFFGIAVMSADRVIAFGYYSYLDMTWAGDLLQTQYLGGGIAWAGGEIPLVIVVVVLLAQWAIQDTREAKRKDRHIDSGVDAEFDAYNEMLRKLAERPTLDRGDPAPRPKPSEPDHT